MKNPVTPPGIDPGTARLVAQRLNHTTPPQAPVLYIYIFFLWCFVRSVTVFNVWRVVSIQDINFRVVGSQYMFVVEVTQYQ